MQKSIHSIDLPFGLDVSGGNITGADYISKFGINTDISTAQEVIWDNGGMYSYLETAQQLDISSTSNNDDNGSTGAWTIKLQGLDADYNILEETITLNGTTPVTTTRSFLRIFRMSVETAGTSGKAEGVITAKVGATTYAQIVNGNNQTLMALYTIPAGYNGYLIFGKASASTGKSVIGSFFTRPLGGVFNLKHQFYLYQNNYEYKFAIPLKLPEKTDIELRAISDQAATGVAAGFDLILLKN